MGAAALKAAEDSVVTMIGGSFTGAASAASVASGPEEQGAEVEKFDFDPDFQTKVAALVLSDNQFMRRMCDVVRPEYFENVGEAVLVDLAIQNFHKYGSVPDKALIHQLFKDALKSKRFKESELKSAIMAYKGSIKDADLSNAKAVEDQVVAFARHQALGEALLKAISLRERGEFDKALQLVKAATQVGVTEDGDGYDYFERIEERTNVRIDKAAGLRPPQGITTGIPKMDEVLYHAGWGRRELASIMGGAKAGKTTALIGFARAAALAGFNVLYASLEVGSNIIGDRMDASLTDTFMKDLVDKCKGVKDRVEELKVKAGKLIMHEYPSGTLTTNQLRALLERYKSPGLLPGGGVRPPIVFDLIVVDYADIMAPNNRTNDAIENSKSVYVDLRAVAFDYNAAVLTATQTNREGYKSAVAKAEHVSEDFNKVRTVDLMISINKTEEEAARGEARLYFAASRNQESGFTIVIRQNLAMMKFVEAVLRVE